MKRILLIIGGIVVALVLTGFILITVNNEALPNGKEGPAANALAKNIQKAMNRSAWDSTLVLQWTFVDRNHYLWDRNREVVQIKWNENEVLLSLKDYSGKAFTNGVELDAASAKDLIKTATASFHNDSFWFMAPMKLFDEGTSRKIVEMEDGRQGLLITYSSGGTTPGDSYLWLVDANNLPVAYKMWVSTIPLGGMKATWSDWKEMETGALYASSHMILNSYNVSITNVKGAANWTSFGLDKDPFVSLTN